MASRVVCAVLLLAAPAVCAAERAFPFTWDSTTLAPKEQELTFWMTPRLLRQNSLTAPFSRIEARTAFSFGVTSWLEGSVAGDVVMDDEGQKGQAVDAKLSTWWRAAPWKAKDVLGVSLLLRGSLGFGGLELEARLVLDKRLGDVWLALNSAALRGFFFDGASGVDTHLEQSAAVGYVLTKAHVTVSAEARARSGFLAGRYQGTAFYLGPAITLSQPRWWLSATVQAQAAADRHPDDRALQESLELRDNERFVVRFVAGVRIE